MKNIFFAFLLLPLTVYSQKSTNQIYLLTSKETIEKNKKELNAAFKFASELENFDAKLIYFEDLLNDNELINDANIVWIHRPDSSNLTNIENNPMLIRILKDYIYSGGKLLLTLDALKYLTKLGFENQEPETKYVDAIDEGYGRKLGLHSFRNHPIFEGLFGGAYIWNPLQDEKVRLVGYFDDVIPNGKVVAIHWAYIRFFENYKLVLEHQYGKGKILSIGAYAYFSQENNNEIHLKKFFENTLNYLTGKYNNEKYFYWEYDSLKTIKNIINLKQCQIPNSNVWNKEESTISVKSQFASDNLWDVVGQRIAVFGFEKSGIDEVWTHPFMAFRDYELGIKFEYRDTIYWFKDQIPQIEIRPEGVIRTYQFPRAFITEIITCDVESPVAILHYEYRGVYDAELVVKIKSNLRLMWPYSENVIREMKYGYDEKNNLFLIKDRSEDFVSIFGSSKNAMKYIVGQFDNFNYVNKDFIGIPTDKHQAEFLSIYKIFQNDNFEFVISGSSEGVNKTFEYYEKGLNEAEIIYRKSLQYYKSLFNDKLFIETPDKIFNEAYKWALVGADKFFAYTPDIGSSLLAGYATTRTGWDGGHKINGRPGYAWYFGRDAQWSGLAIIDYGDFEKIKEVLKTFQKFQDLSGKIYHELTTSGAVHYDAADATLLYIILFGHYLRHSGDLDFIRESYPFIKKAIDFCFSTDTDGDKLIENTNVGHGWVEGGSLFNAHTELYLAAAWAYALKEASYIAKALDKTEEYEFYQTESKIITKILNEEFWNVETNHLNFAKLKDGSYNEEISSLSCVPLYFELIDKDKGEKTVDLFSDNSFSSDWGVRIISEFSPNFNPRGYHFGSVWPLFTGWTSLAEYKYGNYLQGFSHLMNNLSIYKSFSPGYIEEVLHGLEYKPMGVCPHQCWSQTMALQPIYEGMLNIKIDALKKYISISPSLPYDWDSLIIENIRINNSKLNFNMSKNSGNINFNFNCNSKENLYLSFNPSFPLGSEIQKVLFNGIEIPFKIKKERQCIKIKTELVITENNKLEIYLKEGVGVLPAVSNPIPYQESEGFRILSTELISDNYKIIVQGKPLQKYLLEVYSPNHEIDEVTGGKVIGMRDDSIYQIEVLFNEDSNKYIDKIISIELK
ncbi:MAG: DUF4960 domain-containing protein [Ignavibacteriales bacterium]|nr:DUF4960 domain-containing protein [Ignavibacteriales bacterium]